VGSLEKIKREKKLAKGTEKMDVEETARASVQMHPEYNPIFHRVDVAREHKESEDNDSDDSEINEDDLGYESEEENGAERNAESSDEDEEEEEEEDFDDWEASEGDEIEYGHNAVNDSSDDELEQLYRSVHSTPANNRTSKRQTKFETPKKKKF
jgi:hypothetical protein